MFSFFKHLFLPHPTNNHRARILHPKGITFLLSLLTITQIILMFISNIRPDILGFATDISAQRLLELTNQKRLENGIPPLSLNQELSQAATGKANDMFSNNYWAHISPSGKTPWDFIISAGYQYVYAGENLAKDFQDAQGVVNAWMDSPSHRDNLLQEKYKDVGFAVVNGKLDGEETTLVVQLFGTRSLQIIAQEQESQTTRKATSPLPTFIQEPSPTSTPIPSVILKITPEVKEGRILESKLSPSQFLSLKSVAVKKTPKIDLFSLSKNLTVSLVILLIIVLVIDAIIVSRQRIIRISGNNLTHIFLLFSLLVTLLLINRGSIL